MDTATKNTVGLLRDLADELEAGRGVAIEVKIDTPKGYGWNGETNYTRTYALSVTTEHPRKPEVKR